MSDSMAIGETKKWMEDSRQARLEERLPDNVVKCHLSPRNCVIKEGGSGFCKVRVNRGGRLVTLNYGKGVHHTEETIETEAVFHYAPGERILSMGNIGCMLNCGYCHNWKTSQARYVSDKDIHYYTPEQVIDIALRHGIKMLSWTYNDPVVWHEFILDTAKLAQRVGIKNLYKSAFYISPEGVSELLPYIDIFSISIKAIDPEYYRKITTGTMQPVLDATKQVYKAGKHVEVSTLMVTDISDDEESARKITNWVLTELDETVPMHFVRFHPDYKMINTIRTPIHRLKRAKEVALEMGAQHVYIGNVYDPEAANTKCNKCGNLLVTRYGLNARGIGLDDKGHCKNCGHDAHFKLLNTKSEYKTVGELPTNNKKVSTKMFSWHGDINSVHIQAMNTNNNPQNFYVRRIFSDKVPSNWRVFTLEKNESYRFIVSKGDEKEEGLEVVIPEEIQSNIHEVFDRAHFPTESVEEVGLSESDITPSLKFSGKKDFHETYLKRND